MTSFRNFGIAFVAALLVFAGLAYWGVGTLALLFNPADQGNKTPDWQDTQKWEDPAAQNKLTPIESGRSFNMVIVGTDYDPVTYNDYDKTEGVLGQLVIKRKVEATTILFVRFDREQRAIVMSNIPCETLITVDHVQMTLGEAYEFKGAEFVSQKVSALTGMTVDFTFSFSGREFADFTDKRLLDSSFTVPNTVTTSTSKGLASKTFTKGQIISEKADLYTLLHHTDYSLSELKNRYALVQSIFLQTLKKITVTQNPDLYYNNYIAHLQTNMTKEDVSELMEVLYLLPLYIDAPEDTTTVLTLDYYKYGTFDQNGFFTPDMNSVKEAFAPYKQQ